MKKTKTNGFALLLALIVSSVVLAIGISILDLSINQLTLSSTSRESEIAFQAAHAGVDCQWYWRYELASQYTASDAATQNPSINCFAGTPITSSKLREYQDPAFGYVDLFVNIFNWGDPKRCTRTQMYVFNATAGDLVFPFTNTAIGDNGIKTCKKGNTCTVLVSDGYNLSCDNLTSGVFAVQRELTVEF